MRTKWIMLTAGMLALSLLWVGRSSAQPAQKGQAAITGLPGVNWPMFSGDPAGTRFSTLKQITASNVGNLKLAWSKGLRPTGVADDGKAKGGPAGVNVEATPIVVNNVMYLPAGNRILAIEADSGKEVWTSTLSAPTTARGVAYWPGDGQNPARIVFVQGSKLVALNANSGKIDPGFGREGSVEIQVGWNGVPAIYKHVVVLGAFNDENIYGESGNSRAYDARTGAKLWEFHSIPQPGEPGFGSWAQDSWKKYSGANVWGWYITLDEKTGTVFMPFGSPAGNYYGADRPGNNLFGNSIVAMDALTGKYKWHFQTVHHDLWDSDLPPAPSLFEITQNGKKIPVIAAIGKTALMFILNRETGKPIFGVEERPVPRGDVPGEWYSPTQPFPVKPPQLGRNSFQKEDIVTAEDTNASHAQACLEAWDKAGGFYNAGPYTPFLFHEEGAPPKSTIQFPGNGGVNWGGQAADPTTGFVYVRSQDISLVGWVEKKRTGGNYGSGQTSPQIMDRGSVNGPGPYFGFNAQAKDETGKVLGNWPCNKPPWGRLWAVNANTGDIAWQVPLGLTESLPSGKQRTGTGGSAGPIVTAGGLVFIGSTSDSRFRAFDAKTGRELWVEKVERNVNANPITYQGANGKQYVAAIATDAVVAFALP